MGENGRKMESWGTRVGVILAVTGSAVGLGNFLRFPGLAAQYEGGAFMIPYFVALLLLGLPVAWAEWAVGRYGGVRGFNSSPGIFRVLWKNKAAPYVGVLGLIVPVGIYMYYALIESWCLAYAWFYLNGTMAELGQAARTGGALPDKQVYVDFFGRLIGSQGDGAVLGGGSPLLLFFGIVFVANFVIIYRGLSKGIEKFCIYAMPALIVCAVIVLVRVLTLPGISAGLGFMWNPRTANVGFVEALLNPSMWMAATGQIFFSLSVGYGVIITYASYLKPKDDIALSSLTSCAGNEFCEVALGGMITIPAAFIFLGAVQVTTASGSSFNLGFMTLPMVFESMAMGYVAGFAFFTLLFLAAITSSLSMLQPGIAALEEGLGLNRKASVAMLGFVTLMGNGFVLYFSKDTLALDVFDFWVGTFFLLLLATVQTILFGWVLGVEKGMAEIDRGSEIRVPRLVGFLLKYVSPVYLLIILGAWLWRQITTSGRQNMFLQIVNSPVAAMSVFFILLTIGFFLLLTTQSVKRWESAEKNGEVRV